MQLILKYLYLISNYAHSCLTRMPISLTALQPQLQHILDKVLYFRRKPVWGCHSLLFLILPSVNAAAAAAAKLLQSCPTLCDPIGGSPPGSARILQARTLEWVAISFSDAWKWKVKVKSLSRVRLFETSWSAAYQAPLSMGFSRQEYWSRLSFPSPGELPDPEMEPRSPAALPSLGFSRQEYWSGFPFPSPMHESEKLKWSRSVVSDSWWPHGLQPTAVRQISTNFKVLKWYKVRFLTCS